MPCQGPHNENDTENGAERTAASHDVGRGTSPTLIKGLESPYGASRLSARERRCSPLAPLLWVGAILIAVPWILASNEAATISYPSYEGASTPAAVPAAAPASTAPVDDPDRISMVIHIPAHHWVDTGIDMCGCTQLRIEAAGTWRTPDGSSVDAGGSRSEESGSGETSAVHERGSGDRLTSSAPYGSLIARVGRDPFTPVGVMAHLSGDQFNDSGTLKLGMNAGRALNSSSGGGEITVFLTGSGSVDHPAAYCAAPVSPAD